jgi:hypothetical protein
MALGQAAGVASSLAIDNQVKVRNVAVENMQKALIEQKATLIYFKDVKPSDPDFTMVQEMGLKGYLPEWTANLDKPADKQTLEVWSKISGKVLPFDPEKASRRELLKYLYAK